MNIVRGTTVDGPGFRTSIYFAGCSHHCPGCHNPSTWDAHSGDVMTLDDILQVVKDEDFDVTLSGGDPLFYPDKTAILAREIKKLSKNIWLYTGYTYESIINNAHLRQPIPYIDIIVDGPYIETLRNTDLLFRGSSNQRILDASTGKQLLFDIDF